MIGDTMRERFENLVLAATALGIAGVLILLYGFMQTPQPMPEPVVQKIERRIKIAVIDTGLQLSNEIRPFLCKEGHYSMVDSSPLTDESIVKHGTNVAGLIAEHLNPHLECLLIIKMVHPYLSQFEWDRNTSLAVNYAVRQNAQFINMSFGGGTPSHDEFTTLQEAIKKGVKFSVAAGNYKKDLDKTCDYFPACFGEKLDPKFFHVVGSSTGDYSNHGKVVSYLENGTGVGRPMPLQGTSQATAIHTGKWVRSDIRSAGK